jgi:hypothetical protein
LIRPWALLDIGVIFGKIAADAATAAASVGNIGNGTMSAPSDQVGVQVGAYMVEFIAPAKFNVTIPPAIWSAKVRQERHLPTRSASPSPPAPWPSLPALVSPLRCR